MIEQSASLGRAEHRQDPPCSRAGLQAIGEARAEVVAAIRILVDAAVFRLRRFEMANVPAALTIALAIRLPLHEVAVRIAFLFVLNVLALLANDCLDVDQDLVSPNRDPVKPRFLKAHMRQAVTAQIVLGVILVAVAMAWSRGLVIVFAIGEGNCLLYSWKLKRIAGLDVFSIALWGLVMPLAGFPLDNLLGWCLAFNLALFSGAFELMQVMRDRVEDERHGVRTTAVRLGHGRTVALLRAVLAVASVYGILVVHKWICLGLLASLLLPITRGSEASAWNRLRIVLGVVWLAGIAWILVTGTTDGLLVEVSATDTIPWLEAIR